MPENTTPNLLLQLNGVSKAFPGVVANDSIDLSIAEGEIHALLGENGAGKSTLVKIIYGYHCADAGTVQWKGEPVSVVSPAIARQMGIGMVFQHFSLFEAMTVRENIELATSTGLTRSELDEKIISVSESYQLELDPSRNVFELSVGERQRVEIVRCLLQSPKLLIMDEPTSVLTPQEADRLFEVLRKLAKERCAILYISHKLEEIQALCDRATVLRQGKVVAECKPSEEDARSLAEIMIGRELKVATGSQQELGDRVMAVSGLSYAATNERGISLKDINFEVHAGEIFGIAGVAGNGQNELMCMLSGEDTCETNSTIQINGQGCGRLGVRARRKMGVASVPEERLGHGAVARMSLVENSFLSGHDRYQLVKGQWLNYANARKYAEDICVEFDVKHAGVQADAGSLSGGNLQKYLVGREITQYPKVMLACQPTWGVDAGSQQAIHQSLMDLAANGAAVLVISQDLDELLELCGRISVMFAGTLSQPYAVQDLSAEKIGLLMGGTQFS